MSPVLEKSEPVWGPFIALKKQFHQREKAESQDREGRAIGLTGYTYLPRQQRKSSAHFELTKPLCLIAEYLLFQLAKLNDQ